MTSVVHADAEDLRGHHGCHQSAGAHDLTGRDVAAENVAVNASGRSIGLFVGIVNAPFDVMVADDFMGKGVSFSGAPAAVDAQA